MKHLARPAVITGLVIVFAPMHFLSAQVRGARTPPNSGQRMWELVKQTDSMTDNVSYTVIRRSADGLASLRVHCNDKGWYLVFLTVPTTLNVTAQTMAEVRFDKEEPDVVLLSKIDADFLVKGMGGSATDANYTVAGLGTTAVAEGRMTADSTRAAGEQLVKHIRSASRMAYRFSLAQGGQGGEGSFVLTGYDRAAAPMIAACQARQ